MDFPDRLNQQIQIFDLSIIICKELFIGSFSLFFYFIDNFKMYTFNNCLLIRPIKKLNKTYT